MSATVLDATNAWLILLSSAVIIWLFIWGGIKMWHKWQSNVLEHKLGPLLESKVGPIVQVTVSPMFNKLETEQKRQATIIGEIHHEVNLNSGSSIKDAVLAIRSTQVATNITLNELTNKAERIDKGLERHLGMHDGMAQAGRD